MTKYYDSFKACFDRIKADLEAVSSIETVVLGEQFKVASVPMAVINPEETEISQAVFGTMLENQMSFSVVVIIRETEPTDWFIDIVSVMGDVIDKILTDRTLNGAAKDVIPTFFSPGEIRIQGKLYYGGIVRFRALLHFTP